MLNKQVNFIVDSQGHRVAAVVPIDIFDELMTLQKALMGMSRLSPWNRH